MTRRSLLAASAGVLAGAATRPAGVLAALTRPAGVLAALTRPSSARTPLRPSLQEQWLGSVDPGGRTVKLALPADLIGLRWQGPARAGIELRFRGDDGVWSRWAAAGAHGHGPDGGAAGRSSIGESSPATGFSPTAGTLPVGDPVWTGGTRLVQVRATQALSDVRLVLVDVSDGVGLRRQLRRLGPRASAAALPTALPVLAAGPGQPPIIARRAWAQGVAPPAVTPEYGAVRMAFVHHTENPNGYAPAEVPAMLRAIYAFHRYANGWNDIGYNFVIDLYGRIFEARAGGIDESVVGAQAGGYNLASTGVAVLGSFTSVTLPPAARAALERLLAWKLALHGVPAQGHVTVRVNPAGASWSRFPANAQVPLARIAGHRDADSTNCPGDALYGELAGIRKSVLALAPRPLRATLALAPPAPAAAQPPPPPAPAAGPGAPGAQQAAEPRTLSGALEFVDGRPIAGARVLLQERSVSRRGELVAESTIAEMTTDAAGAWTLAVTLTPVSATPRASRRHPKKHGSRHRARTAGTALRVLCPGSSAYGAAVSEPLQLAARISLNAPAGPPAIPPAGPGSPGPGAPAPSQPAAAPPAS